MSGKFDLRNLDVSYGTTDPFYNDIPPYHPSER